MIQIHKLWRRVCLCLQLLLFCVVFLPVSAGAETAGEFRMTMLDVGQGLSVLCESGGEYMLYDGGGREHSSYVVAYLRQHGVERLRYAVVSHYDEDHLAGLIGVLHTTEVDQILSPDYETDTEIFASWQAAVSDCRAVQTHPRVGETYSFGNGSFQILGPSSYEAEAENNRSLALRLDMGSFRAVMTGDAEWEEEQEILDSGLELKCDLYVAGHHGSASSGSYAFLDAMSPDTAWISVGADNPYGHPAESTLEALQDRGISVYRSDLMGEVTCLADDGRIRYSTEKTEGSAGNAAYAGADDSMQQDGALQNNTQPGDSLQDSSGVNYILNTNTGKFHYPSCKSVGQMKASNKQEYAGSREELIDLGYSPCGNCRP